MVLKEYLEKSINKINLINSIFKEEILKISLDKLNENKKTDHEVIYFNKNDIETELIFIFGFEFFIKELEDQEFKKSINQNHLYFKIIDSYRKLKRRSEFKDKKIRISDILNQIQNKEKDSLELDIYIQKILSLSYYLGWELKKDKNSIENDFFIEIPEQNLIKIKQRFNYDIIKEIFENEEIFIFINGKGKLISIFKNKNYFTKKDIEEIINPILKKLFHIKKIEIN